MNLDQSGTSIQILPELNAVTWHVFFYKITTLILSNIGTFIHFLCLAFVCKNYQNLIKDDFKLHICCSIFISTHFNNLSENLNRASNQNLLIIMTLQQTMVTLGKAGFKKWEKTVIYGSPLTKSTGCRLTSTIKFVCRLVDCFLET